MMWGWSIGAAETAVVTVFWVVVGLAYLMALFAVIGDLVGDHGLGSWWKALWVLVLVFVPLVAVLAYIIIRQPGMELRRRQAAGG